MQPERGVALMPTADQMLPVKNIKRITTKKEILPKKLVNDTAPGIEGTQLGYGTIAAFSMNCKYHPEQRETLTQEQLDVINSYPVTKQIYRKIPLTKRVR